MKRPFMIVIVGWLLGGLVLLGSTLIGLNGKARLGVAYQAKILCSEVFIAGREVADVLARDFNGIDPVLAKVTMTVDDETQTVSGSLFGLGKSAATYRPGQGCALHVNGPPDGDGINRPPVVPHIWPVKIQDDIQTKAAALIGTQNPDVGTRAVVVVQGGTIIAQDYAAGFGPDQPMQSWSMAKSVTQALVGIAEGQGKLSLSDRALMPAWTGDDARAQITLTDMLHMSSGLEFIEDYADPTSDVSRMLFMSRDMGVAAAQSPAIHPAGDVWDYSSGTSNIIAAILRRAVEGAGEDFQLYPYRHLFGPLGMQSPVFETDPGGTIIGSSYLYASPQDWARLGQLYLQNGEWNGRQIIPASTISFASTPANPGKIDYYGGHWWLNASDETLTGFPRDAYYMGGHDGQHVIVVPSKNAVIVKLGITRAPAEFKRDVLPHLVEIIKSL